jgi:hypothetical protein
LKSPEQQYGPKIDAHRVHFLCVTVVALTFVTSAAALGSAGAATIEDSVPTPASCNDLKSGSRQEESEPLIKACQFALALPRTLPDLVCTETVKRYLSPKNKPDIITAGLTVARMHSHYSSVLVNGKFPRAYQGKSGDDLFQEQVFSWGEFALLFDVFDPLSHAEFASPVDTKIGRQHLRRYDFRVKRENNLGWTWLFMDGAINPGYHGSLFIDNNGQVARMVAKVSSEEVDLNTAVSSATTTLDYGEVVIGAAGAHRVPIRGETVSCFRALLGCIRQSLIFSDFHKFGSNSRIILPWEGAVWVGLALSMFEKVHNVHPFFSEFATFSAEPSTHRLFQGVGTRADYDSL